MTNDGMSTRKPKTYDAARRPALSLGGTGNEQFHKRSQRGCVAAVADGRAGACAEPADDNAVINEDMRHRDPFPGTGAYVGMRFDEVMFPAGCFRGTETARCKQMNFDKTLAMIFVERRGRLE